MFLLGWQELLLFRGHVDHEVKHMAVLALLSLTLGDELHEMFTKGHPVSAPKMKEQFSVLTSKEAV